MSHFSVIVISEQEPTNEVLTEILQPYYENGENEQQKWDWWQLGGRFTGKFVPGYDPDKDPANKAKCDLCNGTGKRTDMVIANGCNGCGGTGTKTLWPTQWRSVADQMQMKDIPVAALRDAAEREAAASYDKVHAVIASRAIMTWDEVRAKHGENIEAAREEYNGQRVLKDLRAARLCVWEGHEHYAMPRSRYLKLARDGALASFAVVKDGRWYERGEMGWWGNVADEKDRDLWYSEFAKLIDGLSPETWLSVVDCHI